MWTAQVHRWELIQQHVLKQVTSNEEKRRKRLSRDSPNHRNTAAGTKPHAHTLNPLVQEAAARQVSQLTWSDLKHEFLLASGLAVPHPLSLHNTTQTQQQRHSGRGFSRAFKGFLILWNKSMQLTNKPYNLWYHLSLARLKTTMNKSKHAAFKGFQFFQVSLNDKVISALS